MYTKTTTATTAEAIFYMDSNGWDTAYGVEQVQATLTRNPEVLEVVRQDMAELEAFHTHIDEMAGDYLDYTNSTYNGIY